MNAPAIQAAPIGLRYRVSSDSVWPLRCSDGRTFAERKAARDAQRKESQ